MSRDLAESQVEKLRGLVDSIDFEDEDSLLKKVKTVKESYFNKAANICRRRNRRRLRC